MADVAHLAAAAAPQAHVAHTVDVAAAVAGPVVAAVEVVEAVPVQPQWRPVAHQVPLVRWGERPMVPPAHAVTPLDSTVSMVPPAPSRIPRAMVHAMRRSHLIRTSPA